MIAGRKGFELRIGSRFSESNLGPFRDSYSSRYFRRNITQSSKCSAQHVLWARQEIAVELLQRLRAITLEKILEEIRQALNQHYDKGLAAASPEDSYHYKSEYVQISAHRSEGRDKPVTTFLMPARGHRVIKEGYDGVYYPTYYVELAVQ